MKNKFKLNLELYIAFFKIGLLSFGGGISMLPMIIRECSVNHDWANEDELLTCFAIGQCTPGIIAVNVSTFIGFKNNKFVGATFATLGIITPSIFIISLIAFILEPYMKLKTVIYAFNGIKIAVSALLIKTFIMLFKKSVKDVFGIIIFLLGLTLSLLFSIQIILVVICAAIIGIIYSYIKEKRS